MCADLQLLVVVASLLNGEHLHRYRNAGWVALARGHSVPESCYTYLANGDFNLKALPL